MHVIEQHYSTNYDMYTLGETDKMDAICMVAHDAFHLLFDGFYLFPQGDETADSLIKGY